MVDYRDGISFEETLDPQACNVGASGNWREMSRDPESEFDLSVNFLVA